MTTFLMKPVGFLLLLIVFLKIDNINLASLAYWAIKLSQMAHLSSILTGFLFVLTPVPVLMKTLKIEAFVVSLAK